MELGESHFRLLVQSVKDYAIFLLGPDGSVLSWNAGAERIKGWKADEIVGKHFSAFYTAEDNTSQKWKRHLEQALAHGSFEANGWRVRKDGSQFWASIVITALHENGRHVGFAKVTRDLTDTTYRAFVETTHAIVWTTDANGRPNADSPSWRAFTGQSIEQWRDGESDAVHPDERAEGRVAWSKAKESEAD
jgi:PAS domain S-box-containing protein